MYSGFWCLICTLPLLNHAVYSENANRVMGKNLKRDVQNGIFYANFITEKSRYLNVSSIIATVVKRAGQCGQSCAETPPCFSFNLASSSDVKGKLLCELLSSDKFNSSDKLQVSEHFNHYSIKSVCDTKPCQNGGRCVAKYEEDDFSCSCVPGYEGRYCETDINECSSNPCQNGGTCTDQVNGYVCSCVAGFSGNHCETDINECSSNPCQNGGSCTDQVNRYVCSCVAGFSGNHCETDIDECSGSPCQNSDSCIDQINGYLCICVAGYTGHRCETDINECSSNPCQNGGSCINQVNRFVCSCALGYTGQRCQNREYWTEYTPYICGSTRVKLSERKTADECKNLCESSCVAVEWWETGSRPCYECKDTSNKQTYTNQNDAAWPPHLFIKT